MSRLLTVLGFVPFVALLVETGYGMLFIEEWERVAAWVLMVEVPTLLIAIPALHWAIERPSR